MLRKIISYIDDHIECVRYLWPNKNVSVRFKFLNWVSADWLRIRVANVKRNLRMVQMHTEIYERSTEPEFAALTDEECRNLFKMICMYVEYVDEAVDELFKI